MASIWRAPDLRRASGRGNNYYDWQMHNGAPKQPVDCR